MDLLIFILCIIICIIFAVKAICIVPKNEMYVVERQEYYHAVWHTGLHYLTPVIDKIVNKIPTTEIKVEYTTQQITTRDNIQATIHTNLIYKVVDAYAYTYEVDNPLDAIEKIITQYYYNKIYDIVYNEIVNLKDNISSELKTILDEATCKWGINIIGINIENINTLTDFNMYNK